MGQSRSIIYQVKVSHSEVEASLDYSLLISKEGAHGMPVEFAYP